MLFSVAWKQRVGLENQPADTGLASLSPSVSCGILLVISYPSSCADLMLTFLFNASICFYYNTDLQNSLWSFFPLTTYADIVPDIVPEEFQMNNLVFAITGEGCASGWEVCSLR